MFIGSFKKMLFMKPHQTANDMPQITISKDRGWAFCADMVDAGYEPECNYCFEPGCTYCTRDDWSVVLANQLLQEEAARGWQKLGKLMLAKLEHQKKSKAFLADISKC